MTALPVPRTTTDELLVALHSEIVGLRADLAASRAAGEPEHRPEPQQNPARRRRP